MSLSAFYGGTADRNLSCLEAGHNNATANRRMPPVNRVPTTLILNHESMLNFARVLLPLFVAIGLMISAISGYGAVAAGLESGAHIDAPAGGVGELESGVCENNATDCAIGHSNDHLSSSCCGGCHLGCPDHEGGPTVAFASRASHARSDTTILADRAVHGLLRPPRSKAELLG